MFSLPRYSLLFLAIIFLSANLAKATVTWTQIDYPGATNTDVRGINNKGDAVGKLSGHLRRARFSSEQWRLHHN